MKIAHAIAAHPARRSRCGYRRGNLSTPKRHRVSRCAFAASPCRRRCRGMFCRWLCVACRRQFCLFVQLCRLNQPARLRHLMQAGKLRRLYQPERVRPTRPVCRRCPGRCTCRRGSGRSPTKRCPSSCRDGVAGSPHRRRDRDDLGFSQGACPACRARPAASSGRDWARAGSWNSPRRSRFCP